MKNCVSFRQICYTLARGGGGIGHYSPSPLKLKPTHRMPLKVTEEAEGEAAENTVTFAREPSTGPHR